MTRHRLFTIPVAVLALSAVAAGCGSSSRSPAAAPATTAATPPAAATTAASAAGALTAEAQAAAAGDIPDNQVFLAFNNAAAGYSIRYPEGWLQRGHGQNVTFKRAIIDLGAPNGVDNVDAFRMISRSFRWR